jgi:hypothetical protein
MPTHSCFQNLLTAKQAVVVYAFAGVTKERLPKRIGQVSVFPSPIDKNIYFEVRKTAFSATYGGKLFEITHKSQEGQNAS